MGQNKAPQQGMYTVYMYSIYVQYICTVYMYSIYVLYICTVYMYCIYVCTHIIKQ